MQGSEVSFFFFKFWRDTHLNLENEAVATGFVPTKRLKGKSYRDAADSEKATKVESAKVASAKNKHSGPSGLTVEVVIPVHRKPAASSPSTSNPTSPATTPAPSSSGAEETNDSDEDSDVPRTRKRRSTSKKAIIISDDDEDEEPLIVPRRKALTKKGRSKPKANTSSSSDYDEEQSAEESASESDSASIEASSSDDEPKLKSRKKAPTKLKKVPIKSSKKQLATSSEGSDDSMDVDEPTSEVSAKTNGKKRKADGDGKQPAKKQKRREDTDPWKLESPGVKRDWTQMQAPPLEMFHFARIVVDEYTYLDGKTHSMVTRQTGDRRWVLSGTVSIFDMKE